MLARFHLESADKVGGMERNEYRLMYHVGCRLIPRVFLDFFLRCLVKRTRRAYDDRTISLVVSNEFCKFSFNSREKPRVSPYTKQPNKIIKTALPFLSRDVL